MQDDKPEAFHPLVFAVNAIDDAHLKHHFALFLQNIQSSSILTKTADKRRAISLFIKSTEEDEESSDDDIYRTFHVRKNHEETCFLESSYAKHQPPVDFFDIARIISVSERYGFPPSRDPNGEENIAFAMHSALKRRTDREASLIEAFERYPQHGIVASGWLEKHVHALPSVIMVIVSISKNQKSQDQRLFECIQHLQYSLVPKRQCKVQIVGILNDITDDQAVIWSNTIASEIELHTNISITVIRNNVQDENLRKLHCNLRDASLLYYLRQARRFKDKIHKILIRKGPPDPSILFLLIRYCFKVGVFYEFQMKRVKSLQYMNMSYKYTAQYYEYLCMEQLPRTPESSPNKPRNTVSIGEDGIEVSSNTSSNNGGHSFSWSRAVPTPPLDMIHQCRGVAEWLNQKLLKSGLSSHTEGGLLAASNQWRIHCRLFATRKDDVPIDSWFDWLYITQQRTLFANLVNQYPPPPMTAGNDETVLRCSVWRAYEAAAEATLKLARELEVVQKKEQLSTHEKNRSLDQSERSNPPRARFMGGLVSEDWSVDYQHQVSINHREKALQLIQTGIELFEKEQVILKRGFYAEDDFSERSSSRTGARLYYLAGGILLGMGRHQESAEHLTKASHYSRGWPELELSVRRMLIECYETHIPSQSEASSENLASMILDSYFNAEMSSHDLRKALDHFAQISGGNKLQWYHETWDEEDTSLPFSFAVSFPGKTHATCGDTVACSVMIRSNLDYAVQVNSVALTSLAGKLDIPKNDLLSAVNASEGAHGGIIIQAKTAIIVSTTIDLPKDVSLIAADESGNGGELLGVAGKGSFAKNAKPRTAGITSAGGARLVSEDSIEKGNESSGGWNVRFLGGKPLLCEGLQLVFYPVQAEASGTSTAVTLIELQIAKKKKRTAANIIRTPFEEENYLASAWSRPLGVPFSRGPRSLRVLAPMPEMVVANVTEAVTQGKALEGTVNRILLQLQAGPEEACSDLKLSVSCFSVLITPIGATKRLVPEEEIKEGAENNSLNMNNPGCRTPMLVQPASAPSESSRGFGYDLPHGWEPCGSGMKNQDVPGPSIKNGETKYIHLDLFRPAVHSHKAGSSGATEVRDEDLGDVSMCKTDFYVTIAYNQKRPVAFKQKARRRRSSRRRPVMSKNSPGGPDENIPADAMDGDSAEESSDIVSLEFSGSIVWTSPISANIVEGSKIGHPSGSWHTSNKASVKLETNNDELLVVDNDPVSLRCSLQVDPSSGGIKTEIVSVRFEDDDDPRCPLSASLVRETERNLIYNASREDPCRFLAGGSSLQASYFILPRIKESIPDPHASAHLGCVLVDWKPCPLEINEEADELSGTEATTTVHGPLALSEPSTLRFQGPRCHIERTPFSVQTAIEPGCPTVGTPFDVTYSITNNTSLHQAVFIEMILANENSDWLMAGPTSGRLDLGPAEHQSLLFSYIATRPGGMALPQLKVSSDRYDSWIVNEETSKRLVNVMP